MLKKQLRTESRPNHLAVARASGIVTLERTMQFYVSFYNSQMVFRLRYAPADKSA